MKEEELRALLQRYATEIPNGCWIWPYGRINADDYGYIRWNGKASSVHRVVFAVAVRPLAPGEQVLHKCDTPPCFRPDHLFAGTQLDNIRDREQKRRGVGSRTHCRKGHLLSPDNVMWRERRGKPYRVCRTCANAYQREHWVPRKERSKPAS